jgi:hypothetical protein
MLLKGLHCHTSSTAPFIVSELILYASLLKGPRSHTSNNNQITSFRLVFHVTEGLCFRTSSNAQITSFRLVFYVTEGALFSYFQYYSILLVHDWY